MLDTNIRDVIEDSAARLSAGYVFPDAGEELAEALREHLRAGRYDGPPEEVADLVTADLRGWSGDGHLALRYYAEAPDLPSEGLIAAEMRRAAQRDLAGVARVERLADNVALVELSPSLYAPAVAGDAVAAAMTIAARADALLLDVRANHGGDPAMVAFVCTYLFGEEPVHLSDMYERDGDRTTQFWTLPYVPGNRLGPDRPVRVLTSATTFSGAEELAYDLQQLGRARVVGERTGGGANPCVAFRVHPQLHLIVPTGRAVNPVTGTNWQDTGVTPDVAVPAERAVEAALADLVA